MSLNFLKSKSRSLASLQRSSITAAYHHSRPCMDAHTLYSYQTKPSSTSTSKPKMSSHSISTLKYISSAELSAQILNAPITRDGAIAIIDVRDGDYVGGHILGCTNVPSGNLDWKMPELVRTLKYKEVVVFHCALSQQRGPSAALRYLRERDKALAKEAAKKAEEGGEVKEQKVYVLEGGFVKWQEKFGEDTRLTEGYQKDIWQDSWY